MKLRTKKIKVKSNFFEVEINSRIDGKNAEARLFFPQEKIVFTSVNDDIETLGNILAVRDTEVYIIGTDDRYNNIYAYEIIRSEAFLQVAQDYDKKIRIENRKIIDTFKSLSQE